MKMRVWLFAICVGALFSSTAHARGPRWRPGFYFNYYPAPPVYAPVPAFVGPPGVYVAPGPAPVYLVPPPPPAYYYPRPAPGFSLFIR